MTPEEKQTFFEQAALHAVGASNTDGYNGNHTEAVCKLAEAQVLATLANAAAQMVIADKLDFEIEADPPKTHITPFKPPLTLLD